MPITLSGDGTITGLTTTGISAVQKLPAGTVLQVVQGVKSDRQTFSLTDNSYQDISSLSASITPTSSSNKILVLVTIGGCGASVTSDLLFRIVRGSTTIALGDSGVTYLSSIAIRTSSNELTSTPAINFLDSPATTSSTTYKIQIGATGNYTGGVNLRTNSNVFGSISTITLMEIAA